MPLVNPYKPNEISHSYQFDMSIYIKRGVISFNSFSKLYTTFCKQMGDFDQTPRSATSDLGLHCLPICPQKGRYAYMG